MDAGLVMNVPVRADEKPMFSKMKVAVANFISWVECVISARIIGIRIRSSRPIQAFNMRRFILLKRLIRDSSNPRYTDPIRELAT